MGEIRIFPHRLWLPRHHFNISRHLSISAYSLTAWVKPCARSEPPPQTTVPAVMNNAAIEQSVMKYHQLVRLGRGIQATWSRGFRKLLSTVASLPLADPSDSAPLRPEATTKTTKYWLCGRLSALRAHLPNSTIAYSPVRLALALSLLVGAQQPSVASNRNPVCRLGNISLT